jgi:hypothetical protein
VQVSVSGERVQLSGVENFVSSNPSAVDAYLLNSRLTPGSPQIWFQNRRQNTRRKTRPLLPHEILPSFGRILQIPTKRTVRAFIEW